ncbi:hypothetical protein OCU04_000898 [Sclerotinia nivalis]|uniref:Uncharacterized protein n=1 Tax=Sclerotinia nivalis TaxID=352851 RepID=A0A9X0AXN4_9HELO|nr:hypothetical protein OCU04_000898 [Sclerotinia nivalis]
MIPQRVSANKWMGVIPMIVSRNPRIQSKAAWRRDPTHRHPYPGSLQTMLERHSSSEQTWNYSRRSPASVQDSEKGFTSIEERSRAFHKFTADVVAKFFKLSNLEDIVRAQDLEIDDLKKELETFKEEHRMWKEKANAAEENLELLKEGNEAAKIMIQDQAVKIQELEGRKNELKLTVEELEDWRKRMKKMLKDLVANLLIGRA